MTVLRSIGKKAEMSAGLTAAMRVAEKVVMKVVMTDAWKVGVLVLSRAFP